MKLSNTLIEKFGIDKMLHFLGGGWIVSMFSPLGWLGILIGFIVMLVVSFIKEQWLDSSFDIKDILAATFGGVISIGIYSLFLLF